MTQPITNFYKYGASNFAEVSSKIELSLLGGHIEKDEYYNTVETQEVSRNKIELNPLSGHTEKAPVDLTPDTTGNFETIRNLEEEIKAFENPKDTKIKDYEDPTNT